MWQRAVAKLGKHILTMTWVVRTNQLVTLKLDRIGNYFIKQKTGNCRISTIGHYVATRLELWTFFLSFPGIMIADHHSIFLHHKRTRRNFVTVTKMTDSDSKMCNKTSFAMTFCTCKYALTTQTNMIKLQCTSKHECILAWTACFLKLCTYMFGWCHL